MSLIANMTKISKGEVFEMVDEKYPIAMVSCGDLNVDLKYIYCFCPAN